MGRYDQARTAGAALLLVLLLGGCGGDNTGNSPPPDTSQVDYVANLRADQHALDRGQLLYTNLGSVDVGTDHTFEITVTDLGKGPQLAHPDPVPQGWVAPPQDVPTGGDVGIRLTCDGVSCASYDDMRKPVVVPGRAVTWSFGLHLGSPGQAHIHIDAVVYRTSSDQVLSSAAPIDVEVSVRRTWAYTLGQAVHWIFTSATGLGLFSGGAVLTAIGGWLRRVRAARRRPDVDRVLAAIPAADARDRALFGLLRLTNRPIREVVAIRRSDVFMHGSAMAVTFPTLSESIYQHRVTGRRLRQAVRHLATSCSGERIFGDGPDTATPEVTDRWRRHCARVNLDLPLTALHSYPAPDGH
ncbi:hypothetical protein E6W39_14120 [Kitasatospora acidiphila]|uniref:Uncharacterized protein n=1 Tax=Kitasatospora acidiphila TaxID=2567942 RepID=A0A540W2E9_9ACTN|nr:hypothetical protein [Kitasatospora acidiphila]TQF03172.1 hypothetical protein E6W39_14120 [Kitasatospora acidiphila]